MNMQNARRLVSSLHYIDMGISMGAVTSVTTNSSNKRPEVIDRLSAPGP